MTLPAPENCTTVREGRIMAVLTAEGRLVALAFVHHGDGDGKGDGKMSVVMATGEEIEI